MKYRDENGDFQDLYFKTGDTLPIGTEVDYDGETAPVGWEEIDNPEEYSTSEVKTNKVWIDGKPIYRKVVHISSLPNNTSTSYDTGISNGNLTYFEAEGKLMSNDENKVKFPYISPYNNEGTITMSIKEDASKINFTTFRDRTSGYADIVLEYTKTTD